MRKANSLEKTLMLGRMESRRRGWQRMSWLDGITDSMDMNLSNLREMVKAREAWHAAVHGVTKSQTRLSDWTASNHFKKKRKCPINIDVGASLLAQGQRIHLPVQETQVHSLIQEDSTCLRTTKPVHHNHWACALKPGSGNYSAHVPNYWCPWALEPVLHKREATETRSPHTAIRE